MGLFDFFRKKDTAATTRHEPIETLLDCVSSGTVSRDKFLMRLTQSEVFILAENTEDGRVKMFRTQDGSIAAFTSPERVLDNSGLEAAQLAKFNGGELLTRIAGLGLIINPFSVAPLKLSAREVIALSDNTLVDLRFKEPDGRIQLRVACAEKQPMQLIEAIKEIARTFPEIQKLFLGILLHPAELQPRHYVIGVTGTADLDAFAAGLSTLKGERHLLEGEQFQEYNRVAVMVQDLLEKPENLKRVLLEHGELIELRKLDHDDTEGISGFFNEYGEPFYTSNQK